MIRTLTCLALVTLTALGAMGCSGSGGGGGPLGSTSTGSRSANVAPRITTAPVTTAVVGEEYRYELFALGNPTPTFVTATNLPAWLSLEGMTLSGTPAAGDVGLSGQIALTVSNGTAPDARQVFQISVSSNGPLFTLSPRATNGILVAPPGTSADDFRVFSVYGQATPDATSGAFSIQTTGEPQLVWATNAAGRLAMVSVMNAPSLDNRVSTLTTAATLTWLNTGLNTVPSTFWSEGLGLALSNRGSSALQADVATNAAAGGELLSTTGGAIATASQALAGTLNRLADAATATIDSSLTINQTHRVIPALPRSGVMVDTGNQRVLNSRRRTVFVATHLQGTPPTLADFAPLRAAAPGVDQATLAQSWKAFRSEGGVSNFVPQGDLLASLPSTYQVTFVGASLRTNLWPAEGTLERQLLRQGITTDAGRLHLQSLALAFGFSPEALGGGLDMITHAAAKEAVLAGLAMDLDLPGDPGVWNLVDVYARGIANSAALSQPYTTTLQALVGGINAGNLGSARAIVSRLALGQRSVNTKDSPVVLGLTASDPIEQFTVDPSQVGSNNGLTIVLEWGENPTDLDSHLIGPENLHLYYPQAESSGSGSPDATHVSLDLDDTSSFGPETTAILEPRQGAYRFAVFNYSDQSDPNSLGIARSGATVKLYQGSNPVPLAVFPAPNGRGNTWYVFDYDGRTGTVTPLNAVGYVANDTSIR